MTGGPIMLLLAALSYGLYWQIISLLLYVSKIDLGGRVDRERIDATADAPQERAAERSNMELVLMRYDDALWQFRDFIKSRLRFASILLIGAPLLGLLGTVIGMLDTFDGLSMKAGHQTTLLVAEGVKKSLITTQTGLTIAIPALFLVYWVRRLANRRELELLEQKVSATDTLNDPQHA